MLFEPTFIRYTDGSEIVGVDQIAGPHPQHLVLLSGGVRHLGVEDPVVAIPDGGELAPDVVDFVRELLAAVHIPSGELQSVTITHVLVTFEAGRSFPSVRHVIGELDVQFADQLDGFIDVLNAVHRPVVNPHA